MYWFNDNYGRIPAYTGQQSAACWIDISGYIWYGNGELNFSSAEEIWRPSQKWLPFHGRTRYEARIAKASLCSTLLDTKNVTSTYNQDMRCGITEGWKIDINAYIQFR